MHCAAPSTDRWTGDELVRQAAVSAERHQKRPDVSMKQSSDSVFATSTLATQILLLPKLGMRRMSLCKYHGASHVASLAVCNETSFDLFGKSSETPERASEKATVACPEGRVGLCEVLAFISLPYCRNGILETSIADRCERRLCFRGAC